MCFLFSNSTSIISLKTQILKGLRLQGAKAPDAVTCLSSSPRSSRNTVASPCFFFSYSKYSCKLKLPSFYIDPSLESFVFFFLLFASLRRVFVFTLTPSFPPVQAPFLLSFCFISIVASLFKFQHSKHFSLPLPLPSFLSIHPSAYFPALSPAFMRKSWQLASHWLHIGFLFSTSLSPYSSYFFTLWNPTGSGFYH